MINTILSYLTDVGKLYILIYGIFNIKRRKKHQYTSINIMVNIGVLMLCSMIGIADDVETYIEPLLAILTIAILSDSWKRIFIIIPSYLFISFGDMLAGGIVALITQKGTNELTNSVILLQICNSFMLVTLFFIYLGSRKIKQLKFIFHEMKYSLLVILTLGIIGALLYIAPLMVSTINAKEFTHRNEIIFGITLSGIILMIVYTTLIVIYNKNHYYKENLRMSDALLLSQQKYYKSILKKEEDTRKFRHDITHHMNCLLQLQKEERYDELEGYLLDMSKGINEIKRGIDTGNELINIIVEDICSNYVNSKIKVNWKGIFPEKTRFTNMDICIMFSNILKNAFESELEWKKNVERENVGNKNNYRDNGIYINIKNINRALYIHVMNDTNNNLSISKNQTIHTTKLDKENHGYGTKIIKDIVEKYGGTLTYNCEKHLFSTEILFENIII